MSNDNEISVNHIIFFLSKEVRNKMNGLHNDEMPASIEIPSCVLLYLGSIFSVPAKGTCLIREDIFDDCTKGDFFPTSFDVCLNNLNHQSTHDCMKGEDFLAEKLIQYSMIA